MQLGTDYKFRDDLFNPKEDGSTVPIELLIDPFQEVVYRYTNVSFKEDDPPRMCYDYEIIQSPSLSMMTLRRNEKFNTALGLILNMLILEAIELNEAGENNLKESNSERGILEEGSSISET